MKIKLFSLSLALALVGFGSTAHAAIQAVFIVMNGTYTVPAGKVLVLQQLQLPQGAGNASTITVYTTNGFNISMSLPGANTSGLYTFATPLKLPGGVQLFYTPNGVGLFGLLVDPQDLYVGINSTLENLALAGGTFSGNVALSSPARATIKFYASTNLSNWSLDNSVAVQPTTNRTLYAFSTPTDSFEERYYRALVRRH